MKITRVFAESPKRFPLALTMGAITFHFLRILKYHALKASKQSLSPQEVAAAISISPFFVSEYDTALRNYSLNKSMHIVNLLKEYDLKSKSNASGEANDGDLLIELIFKILH